MCCDTEPTAAQTLPHSFRVSWRPAPLEELLLVYQTRGRALGSWATLWDWPKLLWACPRPLTEVLCLFCLGTWQKLSWQKLLLYGLVLAHKKCIYRRWFWTASCSPGLKTSDLFEHRPGPGKESNGLPVVGRTNPLLFQPESSRSPGLPWPHAPQTIIATVTREDSGQPAESGQSKRGGGNVFWSPRAKTSACSLQGARDQGLGLRLSPSRPRARSQLHGAGIQPQGRTQWR